MKKLLLSGIMVLAGFAYGLSQELIVDGDMQTEASWTSFWRSDGADIGTITFNYTNDVPAAGSGACLSIYGFGQTGAQVYQGVTITPGHNYSFTGAFKNSGFEELQATWAELILSRREPPEGSDFQVGTGEYIYAMNVWMDAPYDTFKYGGFDGTFQDDFQFKWVAGGVSGGNVILSTSTLYIPDTVTNPNWYVVMKAGCWADAAGDVSVNFNLLFDEISLIDLGEGEPPSGIDQVTDNRQLFNLYPNPSDGIIKIGLSDEHGVQYAIYNSLGMLVKSGILSGSSTLDLSELSKGLYYISLTSGLITETQPLLLK